MIVDVLSGANKSCFRKARRRRRFKGKSIAAKINFTAYNPARLRKRHCLVQSASRLLPG